MSTVSTAVAILTLAEALGRVLYEGAEAAERIRKAAEEGREISAEELTGMADQLTAQAERLKALRTE